MAMPRSTRSRTPIKSLAASSTRFESDSCCPPAAVAAALRDLLASQFDGMDRPALKKLLRAAIVSSCVRGTRFSDGEPMVTWLYLNESECTTIFSSLLPDFACGIHPRLQRVSHLHFIGLAAAPEGLSAEECAAHCGNRRDDAATTLPAELLGYDACKLGERTVYFNQRYTGRALKTVKEKCEHFAIAGSQLLFPARAS